MAQKVKVEKVSVLKQELKEYKNFIFVNYRGMNVGQMNGLRNSLREKGIHFHVVKNIFMKRVFDDLHFSSDTHRFLVEPTALTYFDTELTEVAKLLVASSGETTLQIKGGLLDGDILSSEDIVSISRLPSRTALITQVLGLLNRPISGFVFVAQGILVKFVRTLKAIEEKKAES